MSLKHALLGFINYGPMTGYELKKFFDTSVAHFWNAELSQIYPTLRAMETGGLVEMNVDVQQDRPNRKVYSITEGGRRELLQWLAQPAEPEQIREPLMIKVFFGAALRKQEILSLLRDEADRMKREVEFHKHGFTFIQRFAESIGLQREAFFWGLTVNAGVKQYEAALDWTEETIRKIEDLDDSVFAAEPTDWKAMDVRSATDILERLKTAMPGIFASGHVADGKSKAS